MNSGLRRLDPAVLLAGLVVAALALVGWSTATHTRPSIIAPLVLTLAAMPLAVRLVRRWDLMLSGVILVILWVPIRRYKIPISLPFDLEPYRIGVAALLLLWLGSLLIDVRVRFARSPFDRQILFVVMAALASEVVNPTRVGSLTSYVLKALTFFFSFVLLFYLIVSVVKRPAVIDRLVKVLVGGGALVATSAIIERRTHYNVFDHLSQFVPVLRSFPDPSLVRLGHFRALASAQHPIALSAAMVLLLPLAYYVCRNSRSRLWWVALILLLLGDLTTASRTGIVMLLVMSTVLIRLQGVQVRRLWPLIVPFLLVVHLVVPGALGSIRAGFFPAGGLVKQQTGTAQQAMQQNTRLSRIGPATKTFSGHALLGIGYGTRITGATQYAAYSNAVTLDDQWLGNLLETGLVGVLAWLVLFWKAITRFGRAAREDRSERGAFFAAIAASIAAFAVGMLTYDAFAFIQVTFIFWIIFALGAARLMFEREAETVRPVPA